MLREEKKRIKPHVMPKAWDRQMNSKNANAHVFASEMIMYPSSPCDTPQCHHLIALLDLIISIVGLLPLNNAKQQHPLPYIVFHEHPRLIEGQPI